jgi:hypothetical protein
VTILHAAWGGDDRLHLWGERRLTGGRLPRPKGRAPQYGRPRRHPYAAPADDLHAAVAELTGVDVAATAATCETAVAIPSTATSPLPSPDLPGASDIYGGVGSGLQPWRVDAVALDGADALTVLLAVPADPPSLARPGGSLQAAVTLATLAVELVARGRVLPGLEARHGRFEARWLPVLDGADGRRLASLVPALPPALLAAADGRRLASLVPALPPALLAAADEENRPPGSVLREIIEQLVDAACRTSLAGWQLAGRRTASRGGIEEAWLDALTAEDPAVVHPDVGALQVLGKELDTWHRSGQQDAPLRVTFRLVSPRDDDEAWRVEFALQAADDPSVLVSAAQLWAEDDAMAFLSRSFEDPELRLLADLGVARRLYPALDRALEAARPHALDLGLGEVLEFLRDTAPLLEQSGYGVLLPDELRHPLRLSARLRTASRKSSDDRSEGSGLLGYEGIVDYRWEVAVGDQTLTAEELLQLAALKAPLVRLRGQWVELVPTTTLPLRAAAGGGPGRVRCLAEAPASGSGRRRPRVDLEFAAFDADGPLAALLDPDTNHELALLTPDGLDGRCAPTRSAACPGWRSSTRSGSVAVSRRHGAGQVDPAAGPARPRACRPFAPIEAVAGADAAGVPDVDRGNWEREAERFAPDLRVHVHHGRDRPVGAAAVRRADLVITTYHLAARDHDDLAEVAWRRIVLDEAQNIKNPAAKQSRAIRALPHPSGSR